GLALRLRGPFLEPLLVGLGCLDEPVVLGDLARVGLPLVLVLAREGLPLLSLGRVVQLRVGAVLLGVRLFLRTRAGCVGLTHLLLPVGMVGPLSGPEVMGPESRPVR